ncbi:MAG: hypothetical protein Q9195_006811 [Heterodermia aff. obscurata]
MAYLMGLMIGERIQQRRLQQMDLKDASEASRGSIIITAIIIWVVTTFGIAIYEVYERSAASSLRLDTSDHESRYAFVPQIIAISILYGVSASHFDLKTPSEGDPRTISGDSLLSGIGLASGITSTPSYSTAYSTSQGALIVTALENRLNGFGRFLGVVIAFGIIANGVFPTYVGGINFQILGRTAARIPRFIWTTVGVVIYLVCALAGRNHLSDIFTNFLAVMGYWLAIWVAITIEEQVIFRRMTGYDWTVWDQRQKLPMGIAALLAFLVGWVGAILCMAQAWYTGPIARLVGEYGADMGNYVGFSWAALVYPPLRWLELKKFGR